MKKYLIFGILFLFVACKKEDKINSENNTLVNSIVEENKFDKTDFKDRAEELIYIREYIKYKLPLIIIEKYPDLAKKAQYELISRGENPTLEDAVKKTLKYHNRYNAFMSMAQYDNYSFSEIKSKMESYRVDKNTTIRNIYDEDKEVTNLRNSIVNPNNIKSDKDNTDFNTSLTLEEIAKELKKYKFSVNKFNGSLMATPEDGDCIMAVAEEKDGYRFVKYSWECENSDVVFDEEIEEPAKPKPSKSSNDALSHILNGNNDGTTGSEKDVNFFKNRKVLVKPTPEYNCNEEGKIIVKITVNKKGEVIYAKAGMKGTTNYSKCLLESCEKAALNTIYAPDDNATDNQIGSIEYNFRFSQ